MTNPHLYVPTLADRERSATAACLVFGKLTAFHPQIAAVANVHNASIQSFVFFKHASSQDGCAVVCRNYHTALARGLVVDELATKNLYSSLRPHHAPVLFKLLVVSPVVEERHQVGTG